MPLAAIGSRALAYGVDFLVLAAAWSLLFFSLTLVLNNAFGLFRALPGGLQGLLVAAAFVLQWGYWTLFEIGWSGQTPGKRLLGIRVVSTEGSPVSVLSSCLRNLLRILDALPLLYGLGSVLVLATRREQRFGDLMAGTVVRREEQTSLGRYDDAGEEGPGDSSVAGSLDSRDRGLVRAFLARAPYLAPDAAAKIGAKLLHRIAPSMSAAERSALLGEPRALEQYLTRRLPSARG